MAQAEFSRFFRLAAASTLALASLLANAGAAQQITYAPGAAEADGLNGTHFSSTLYVTNVGAASTVVTFELVPSLGKTAPAPVIRTLARGESLAVERVLPTLFGVAAGAGTVKLSSPEALVVSLATQNVAGAGGAYGLGLLPVRDAGVLRAGETGHAIWVSQSTDPTKDYRTNVSVTLVDANSSARVRIYDGTGVLKAETTVSSPTPAVWQAPVSSLVSPSDLTFGRAEVEVLTGRATGYTVVNDNVTGDAIAMQTERADTGATDRLVGGAAKTPGLLGTFWSTDLRLFNPGATAVDVTIDTVGWVIPSTVVRTIPAKSVIQISRVLEALSLPDGAACALRIRAAAPVLVGARTSNLDPAGIRLGSFSAQQFVVKLPAGLLAAGATGYFNGIEHTLNVPGSRANLALVGGAEGAEGRLVLRDATGASMAVTNFVRAANEWGQKNVAEWFPTLPGARAADGSSLAAVPSNSRIDVEVTRGALDGFVSAIRNDTGDAITRPIALTEDDCDKVNITSFTVAPNPPQLNQTATFSWTIVTDPPSASIQDLTIAYDGGAPISLPLNKVGSTTNTFTTTGTHTATLSVRKGNCTKTQTLTFFVCDALTITPSSLPSGTAGVFYTRTLGSNGTPPFTWTRTGQLPAGIFFNASSGVISGTPLQTGTFTSTYTVTDANGCTGTASRSITILCPTINVTPLILGNGLVGSPYGPVNFGQTGGVGAISWSAGGLPAGLVLNPGTGVLSGTPTIAGSYNVTVTATDANGCTGSRNYTLVICATITVSPAVLSNGTAGVAYGPVNFTQVGGTGAVTFSLVAGALPAGLSLTPAGVLSGTPTVVGTFNFTVRATDSLGCFGDRPLTLTIACPTINVTPTVLANGTAGVAYGPVNFTQTGGVGAIAWSISAGALPAGLSLSAGGVLSGTPTVVGTFNFTVRATDANNCTGNQALTLTVNCPTINVTPTSLAAGTAGVAYGPVNFTQTGGVGAIGWSVSAGALPTGLSLSAGGVLSGTPTVVGTFNFTVRATDVNACFGEVPLTLVVNCPTISVTPTTLADATAGTAYGPINFSQTGGVGAVGWSISAGALPAGLSLSAGGVLSGTPTVTGTFNFTVRATDANACFGETALTLNVVCPTITVNPATLPDATTGTAYSQTITQTGGVGAVTFAVTAGALPAGLTLATGGALTGTPTVFGTFNFTVTATDANSCTGSRAYTLTVNCPPITVNPASLPGSAAGVVYSQTITATGGTGPYTFAVTAGTLPTGLTLATGGALTGTPTVTGTFNFTVTATDTYGCTGARAYSITIVCPTISVLPTTLANGVEGAAYGPVNFTQTGGVGAVVWSVTAGTLPAGLTFSPAGVLSGTPNAGSAGSYTVTFTATDQNLCTGSAVITFRICPVITVNPATLPNGQPTVAYSQTLSATGGATPYVFTVTAGALPTGLTLQNATATTVDLAGTPTVSGVFNFTITATDANGCTGSRAYTVLICPTITLSPTSPLPGGTATVAYNQTITASGGTGPYTFAVTSGALPAGLTLAAGGLLSGTPTVTGTFNFTVTATDANGCPGSQAYALTIACPTITVNPTSPLPGGSVGVPYSQSITATGGVAPHTFAVTAGSLPPGLTLAAGGLLSGTPTTGGVFNFTITATDANLCTGSTAYSLTVACPTITLSPGSPLPGATATVPYSQTITATGGSAPYTFAVTAGTLPTGITLAAGGSLSGTPTVTGTFNFTITATDNFGCTGSQAYSLTVACPTITVNPTSPLTAGTVGTLYTQNITATGGVGPHTFAVTAGTLPTGLTLTPGGVLSGTPTAAGTFNFTITATDANLCTGSRAYSLTMNCPTITVNPTSPLPNGTATQLYSQTITATGGTAPYTFAVTAGALPTGITLSTGGSLSGTPTVVGTFNFTITATDTYGCTGSRAYALTIVCQTITVTPPSPNPNSITANTAMAPATFTQSGGFGVGTFSLASGTLPTGVTLSAAGVLSGNPQDTGSFPITVTYTDANGCTGTSVTYTLTVVCQTITVTNPGTASFTVGTAMSQTFTQTNGIAPITFTVFSGTLPTGLTLSSAGVLSGTPTQTGSFPIVVRATDKNGCFGNGATYNLTIVCPTITVNPATAPDGVFGVAYSSTTFTQTGSTGSTFTWSISVGALPPGLTLTTGGVLSGTPTNTGVFNFTVTVTDNFGCTGSRAYTVTIRPNAQPDTYNNGVGNTQYIATTACPTGTTPNVCSTVSVLANDSGPAVLTAGPAVIAAANGSVAMNANGTFTYTPNTNFAGPSDTFTYTLTDGNGITNTALVTINLSGRVWYVNASFGGTSTGRSHEPFKTLNAAETPSSAGDTIFIHQSGSAFPAGDGVVLKANQLLWGSGLTYTLNGLTITATTNPTVTGTVRLANSNTLRAFHMATTTNTALTNNGTNVTGIDVLIGTIATSTGTPISLTNTGNTGTVNVGAVTNSGAAANGILVGSLGGTLTVASGSSITNTTGTGVSLTSVTSAVLNGLSISETTQTALLLNSTPVTLGGNLTIATSGGGTGVSVTGGTVSIAAGANTFSITNTGSGPGLSATAGTLTVTGSASTISTQSGTALSIANTTIGAGNVTFRSISAGTAALNPPNGIFLNNTGASGGLIVTGTGSAGSGGTIRNTTGADGATAGIGIYLQNTRNVSLSWMQINDHPNFAIRGLDVTNFTMDRMVVSGVNGTSAAVNEGSVVFDGLFGTNSMTHSVVRGGIEDNVRVENTTATPLTSLTVSGTGGTSSSCQIRDNDTATGNIGFRLAGFNSAVMTVTVTGCLFTGNRTDAINIDAANTSSVTSTVTNNYVIGGSPNQGNIGINTTSGATATHANTVNNNFVGTDGTTPAPLLNTGINLFSGNGSTLGTAAVGFVQNNTVRNAGVGSGHGIQIFQDLTSTTRVNVNANTVSNVALDFGLRVEGAGDPAGPGGSIQAGVTNNNVSVLGTALDAIRVRSRRQITLCSEIRANTTNAGGAGFFGLFTNQANTSTFSIEGLALGAQTAATTQTYLIGQNPAAATLSATAVTNYNGVALNACAIP